MEDEAAAEVVVHHLAIEASEAKAVAENKSLKRSKQHFSQVSVKPSELAKNPVAGVATKANVF